MADEAHVQDDQNLQPPEAVPECKVDSLCEELLTAAENGEYVLRAEGPPQDLREKIKLLIKGVVIASRTNENPFVVTSFKRARIACEFGMPKTAEEIVTKTAVLDARDKAAKSAKKVADTEGKAQKAKSKSVSVEDLEVLKNTLLTLRQMQSENKELLEEVKAMAPKNNKRQTRPK